MTEEAKRLYSSVGCDWLPSDVRTLLLSDLPKVGVACSGGADSVFLLYWLCGFIDWKQSNLSIDVLHFNHNVRGQDSVDDANFVAELASRHGLPFVSDVWDRGDGTAISEDNLREARLKFFHHSYAVDANTVILTGHHGDDVVETMLMRLSRGSGIEGLSAPRTISQASESIQFVRPMLNLERRFIQESLRGEEIVWREDRSNVSEDFYRNRIRKCVAPRWEEASDRNLANGVGLSRRLLAEDSEALGQWLEEAYNGLLLGEAALSLAGLKTLPRALQRRSLRRFAGAVLPPGQMEEVLAALATDTPLKISIGSNTFLRFDWGAGALRIDTENALPAQWSGFALPVGARAYIPGFGWIEARYCRLSDQGRESVLSGETSHETIAFLDLKGKQSDRLYVRPWRNGDTYVPIGANSPRKLKKLFVDRKVPLARRRSQPIFLHENGEILWTPGLPPCLNYLIDANSVHALQLTCVG